MEQSYKLTRHPIGSLKEIWAISWPLMLGLLSGSLMMFSDRFLLAQYSTATLNAAIKSGLACFVVFIIPMMIAGFSEVFVGRYHGAGAIKKVGIPVWQMLWFSAMSMPIFILCAEWLPNLLFYGSSEKILETAYFRSLLYFGPAFCSTIALMGFFIGTGRVKIVTFCAIAGNLVNIGFDYLLIFGTGPFPELGIEGAAIATGLSQLVQTFFLMILFLTQRNQERFGTDQWKLSYPDFIEGLRIGTPAGIGKFLELIAHFLFFQIISVSGVENITMIGIVQSFYLLICFVTEGLSKGVSSIVANLLGADQYHLIDSVLQSAKKLQLFFSIFLGLSIFLFSDGLVGLFLGSENSIIQNNETIASTRLALSWMSLFFLFDGFCWIYMGVLSAAGDTKYLLYIGIITNYLFYILPVYVLFIYTPWGNAPNGWLLITVYSAISTLILRYRYQSGKWKESLRELTSS